MQVTKEGDVPSREEFFKDGVPVTCEKRDDHDYRIHCGAELKIEENDLVPRYWKASHSYKYYFAVVCPRCGSDCFVKVPTVIYRELMTDEVRAKATCDGFSDGHFD